MKYLIFHKRVLDGCAHEHADLREFVYAGNVRGNSLREAERAAREHTQRAFNVGDLLVDENGQGWAYTPYGAWSMVKLFRRAALDELLGKA